MFDELEGLALGFGYRVRITVLRHMGDDLLTKTVGEIEPMSVRRKFARIGFELFV